MPPLSVKALDTRSAGGVTTSPEDHNCLAERCMKDVRPDEGFGRLAEGVGGDGKHGT